MTFVDSGHLIALAKPRDELHARAHAWALHIEGLLVMTEYILCETVDALSRPTDRPKAHRLVAELEADPACRIIAASNHLFNAGLALHASRNDKAWSLIDCISFHVMTELSIRRALAYDEHFEQAGFEPLLRKDPPLGDARS